MIPNHYDGFCDKMWKCFLTTIDYTFKETGAVGVFLKHKDSKDYYDKNNNEIYLGVLHQRKRDFLFRFFFDNSFNLILVVITINLVAGDLI